MAFIQKKVGLYLENNSSEFEYDNKELFEELNDCDEYDQPLVIDKIMSNNTRLVIHLISKRFGTGATKVCERLRITFDDLFSIGMYGLLKSIYSFDNTKGIRFATYVGTCVNNELSMFLRKEGNRFSDVSGDEEHGDDGDGSTISLISLFPVEEIGYSTFIEEHNNLQFMEALGEVLNDKERNVLRMYYYSEMKQRQIADELGLSQSYIARILMAIAVKGKKLYEEMESEEYAKMDKSFLWKV